MEQDYCNKRRFKTLVEDYVDSQMFSSAFKLSIISRDDSYNWPEPDMVFIMVIWSFERPAILSQSFTFNKGWNINLIKFQIFSIKFLNHSSSNLAITFSKHSLSQNTQSILKRSWDFISIVFPYPDLSFTVHSWGLHIRLLSPNTAAYLDRGRFLKFYCTLYQRGGSNLETSLFPVVLFEYVFNLTDSNESPLSLQEVGTLHAFSTHIGGLIDMKKIDLNLNYKTTILKLQNYNPKTTIVVPFRRNTRSFDKIF
jgi:hypothetical protein